MEMCNNLYMNVICCIKCIWNKNTFSSLCVSIHGNVRQYLCCVDKSDRYHDFLRNRSFSVFYDTWWRIEICSCLFLTPDFIVFSFKYVQIIMNIGLNIVRLLFLILLRSKVFSCLFRFHVSFDLSFVPSFRFLLIENIRSDSTRASRGGLAVCPSPCFISEIIRRVWLNISIWVKTKAWGANLLLMHTSYKHLFDWI